MKKTLIMLSLLSILMSAEEFEFFKETKGEIRLGVVQLKNLENKKTSTIAFGGHTSLSTKEVYGLSAGTTFFTSNALFGKKSEAMFLNSKSQSYSIVGEAFIEANFYNTQVKVGRQIVDTPFMNSDDVGMIPNSVEGYHLINTSLQDTTMIFGAFDKWAGVDSDRPERFRKMQDSGDFIMMASVIYEGIESTMLQAWHYKIDDTNWNYVEASYENEKFSLAGQYADQGKGNSVYGLDGVINFNYLSLHTAYNNVLGTVTNGYGGGPFFTSSEDHTVHESLNNEAILMGAEYNFNKIALSVTHVNFTKIEDETDYIVSYKVNDTLSSKLIYSYLGHDGKLTRFFIKQSF